MLIVPGSDYLLARCTNTHPFSLVFMKIAFIRLRTTKGISDFCLKHFSKINVITLEMSFIHKYMNFNELFKHFE